MRRLICVFLVIVFCFLPESVWGQRKVGTARCQFLEIGVSARAIGMGEAFLGICDDASAVYYNPAGLSQLVVRDVIFTHVEYPAEMRYEFVGLAYPVLGTGGVWGVGFYLFDAGDMPYTPYSNSVDEGIFSSGQTFTAKEYALGLSYARALTDHFSVGMTLKFLDELYEEEQALGWAADMGTLYDTGFRNFKIAMVISNFGPDLKFIKYEEPLPMNFKFGGSIDLLNYGDHQARLGLEGSHPSDNLEKYNAGVEYWYKDSFALRVGNQFEHDTGGFSAGAGFRLDLSQRILRVDYGYHDFGYLDQIHRFSVGFSF
jgi:hypothetical protein